MTKEKLHRLIELTSVCVSREGFEELEVLQAEFEAWQPEAATANGQTARYWMNLAQQYAEECITLRHRVRT